MSGVAMNAFGIFCSVGVVFVIFYLVMVNPALMRKRRSSRDDQPKAGKYGHPWEPVTELRKKLPKPAPGHAWEITVQVDDQGDYVMIIGDFELVANRSLESKKINLTRYLRYDMTWAAFYQEFDLIARGKFEEDIIQPLVDWANVRVNKQLSGQTVEYKLEA